MHAPENAGSLRTPGKILLDPHLPHSAGSGGDVPAPPPADTPPNGFARAQQAVPRGTVGFGAPAAPARVPALQERRPAAPAPPAVPRPTRRLPFPVLRWKRGGRAAAGAVRRFCARLARVLVLAAALAYQERLANVLVVDQSKEEGDATPAFLVDASSSLPTRSRKIFHVALIADPQLTGGPQLLFVLNGAQRKRRLTMSYGQEGLALWLTQFYSDYYMLRSERALRFVNRPDAYFVLGDLLDGGRELDGAEWESELRRFVSVFPAAAGGGNGTGPSCHVIAGNHDFGLGDGTVAEARSRFRAFFGPTTRRFDAANHTVVVVDSAALAGRASDCDWESAEASDAEVEVQELLAEIASDESSDPRRRILLTHIPLYRPPTATCGPLRRHGTTISNSQGYQWQNLLGVKCSRKILDMVKPAIVFSGDDHDFCEQRHPVQGLPDAVEVRRPFRDINRFGVPFYPP
ncbi:MAG: Metallo-dependent phosphatase-like protein, partial [Olpidium bornovanus]